MTETKTPSAEPAGEYESLELPSMKPGSLVRKFGPGLMLMMTGIGTSHLVTAPVAGGRFEYALLWCLPIAYIFKYYGFEMAIRFTHATGRSMLDAYATAWKKLPVWYVLITTIIQSAIGQAGRLIAAAAVVFYFFRMYLGIDIPGVDDDGLARKREAVRRAVAVNQEAMTGPAGTLEPFSVLRCLGGHELAGILGAIIAARLARTPVILDGYTCCAAAAAMWTTSPCRAWRSATSYAHRTRTPASGPSTRSRLRPRPACWRC